LGKGGVRKSHKRKKPPLTHLLRKKKKKNNLRNKGKSGGKSLLDLSINNLTPKKENRKRRNSESRKLAQKSGGP